jgi:glycosyltransferase involved in cell wall biosynthesis
MNLSIIIPAYNEEKRIGKTLKAYLSHFENLRKMRKLDYSLIVVINNTTDRTEEIVKSFRKTSSRLSCLNLKKGGKGYATIEGFREALKMNPDLIGFVDADMSTSPEEYSRLLGKLNGYDGIIASRYLPGAVVSPKPTLQRIIVSRVFNFLIRTLFFFPYADTQCGAKIFRKEAIRKIANSLIITKWAFDVDLLYNLRKNKFKIREIPTVWSDKEYSKINFMRAGPFMALAIIRLRLLNSPFNSFVKLYDKMPKWIKIPIT